MRFEIVIIVITALVIANIYTDGKYLRLALTWKKYYQMIGVGLFGLVLIYLLRKNPDRAKDIIESSNEYLKNVPIDKDSYNFIHPIMDFTSKQQYGQHGQSITNNDPQLYKYQQKVMNSGGKGTKRSVSETKKKFVAAKQNWCCGDCKKQLPAWFEVDHTVRLEHGGSNHVDNLVALCRDCHGKKTAIENL